MVGEVVPEVIYSATAVKFVAVKSTMVVKIVAVNSAGTSAFPPKFLVIVVVNLVG